jgi:hypothetical protein
LGAWFSARGAQLYAFARILVKPFVVEASSGSLMTPAPIGKMLTLRVWLMSYMRAEVGPMCGEGGVCL